MMGKQVILCVDDEKFVLDTLRTQLTNHFGSAYLCEIAENADDAMELIEEFEDEQLDIIVIVSDWLMPGIKGDEFLIRVHQRFPKIVKVMLTGQASPEAVERATREAHLHRCLYKPWSEAELVDTIQTGLATL